MVAKVFSAQFLMAVIVTVFACVITLMTVIRWPQYVELVVPVFFTNWGIIITNYFKRDRSQDAVPPIKPVP